MQIVEVNLPWCYHCYLVDKYWQMSLCRQRAHYDLCFVGGSLDLASKLSHPSQMRKNHAWNISIISNSSDGFTNLMKLPIYEFFKKLTSLSICTWFLQFSSLMNLIFSLFQTWILQTTACRKIQFKLGKKKSVHQTQYFKLENCKYQVQIDRRWVCYLVVCTVNVNNNIHFRCKKSYIRS